MSKRNIIRAWKDVEYRNSLSAEKRAQLPENPAGSVELNDDDLANVAGGWTKVTFTCCGGSCYTECYLTGMFGCWQC